MKLVLACLSLLGLGPFVSASTYGLGKSWLIGQNSKSNIQKVTTTFNPGVPPTQGAGALRLYPGLSNGTGDLLTTSIEAWFDQTWCGGTTSQWCIRTEAYSLQRPSFGQFAPLDPNEAVTIVFERSSDNSGWTQSATVNDQVVSQLTFPSGPMTLFGITTECVDACALPVSQQTYSNTTIELAEPDLSWGSTAVAGSEVYGGDGITDVQGQLAIVNGLSSQDGKVWTVEEIIIPAMA